MGWLHSKTLGSSRISEKNAAYFRAEEYVSMDRTEFDDVARRTIDNVLGAENSSYTNTLFKVELS